MPDTKILLVGKDNSSKANIQLVHHLKKSNIQVEELEYSSQVLNHLEMSWQSYTAVLMDYILEPGSTSEQHLKILHKNYPRLPIIVFTDLNPTAGIQALGQGAYARLRRPLDFIEVVNIIFDLVEQNRIFPTIAKDVRDLLDSDLSIVWRIDRQKNHFHVEAWNGKLDQAYIDKVTFDANDKKWNQFFANGQPAFLFDIIHPQNASRYRHQDEARKHGWASLISIPLLHNNQIIGLVDSYTYTPLSFESEQHKQITKRTLNAFANQAAGAIRHADLARRTQVLQEINQTLADTLEEEAVLRPILYKALELAGTDIGWLYLIDANTGVLQLKESLGIPKHLLDQERKVGDGVTGWVAAKGRVLKVDNVFIDTPCHISIPTIDIKSEVAVPLRRGGQVIGVLNAKSRFFKAFTNDDVDLLRALADQAAIAIERAKLTKHLQEVSHLALTEDFNGLSKYVVTAVRDLTGTDVILRIVTENIIDHSQTLGIVASKSATFDENFEHNALLPLDPTTSINALSLAKGKPIVRRDIQNDTEKPTFHYLGEAKRRGWHSFMAVPLLGRDGEPLGTLSLYSQSIDRFSTPEIEIVQTFANQAAIAFRQQKRTLALQRQASELEAVHQTALNIIAYKDRTTLLQAIVEEATTLLNGKGGKVYLRVPDKDEVQLVAAKEVDPSILPLRSTIPFGQGMAGRVIQSKEPLIIDNYKEWEGRVEELAGIFTAVIEVPLLREAEAIGVLSVFDDVKKRSFTEDDIAPLSRLAQQVALVIHNADLFDKYQNRLNLLDALHKTSLDIILKLERKELIQAIVDRARNLIAGDGYRGIGAAYWECDYQHQKAIVKLSHNPNFKGIEIGFNESLIGDVIRTGQAKYKNGFNQWEDHALAFDRAQLIHYVKNVIEVPVKERDQVIAVIAITDASGQRPFSEEDIDLLERFADLATIAIQKARLFDQIQAQQEAQIRAIGQIASSIAAATKIDQVLNEILNLTADLMGKSNLSEFKLLDEETDELVTYAYIGEIKDPNLRISVGEGITGWAVEHKKSLLVPNVLKDDRYIASREKTRSELAVPMFREEVVIGVLNVENPNVNGLTKRDIQLAEAIAGLAVVALENNALFERLKDRDVRLDLLRATISDAATDLEKIIDLIVNKLSTIFANVPCVIRLYDDQTDKFTLRVAAPAGILEQEADYTPRPDGTSRYTLKTGEAYYIDNALVEQSEQPTIRPEMIDQGVKAMAVLPLLNQYQSLGVLSLYLTTPHQFTRNDKQILELFANQATAAVTNAQLYRHIQARREAEIKAIGDIATSIAIDARVGLFEVLEKIITSIASLMGESNLFVVWLLDETGKELILSSIYGGRVEGRERKIRVGEGITGSVAHHKKTEYVPDVRHDKRYLPGLDQARSELAVPLLKEERLIGVLNVEHPEVDAFTETDIQLAEAIAALIVVAVENAELFAQMEERVEQRTKDWQEEKERAAAAEQLANMGKVAAEFAHRMNNVAGTIPVRIRLTKKQFNLPEPDFSKIINHLDLIETQTEQLLEAAQSIKRGTEVKAPDYINVNILINQAIDRVWSSQPSAENIMVDRQLAEQIPTIYAEESGLLDTLVNIIQNGIESMRNNGVLAVSTYLGMLRDKPAVVITISDVGEGILKKNLPKIFDPFFTTKQKGLGFGLWRDKMLIKMLGGDIEVKSEEGEGSIFTIKIPASTQIIGNNVSKLE